MIIDENGKILGKVSIVDLFFIIIVILIIVCNIFKLGNKNEIGISNKKQYVLMKFYVESLENFTVDKLKVGDIVSHESNDIKLGKIKSLKVNDSIIFKPNSDGVLVKSSLENYSSLEITTELMAYKYQNGILIRGNTYAIGKPIIIRAGNAKIFLKISDISF